MRSYIENELLKHYIWEDSFLLDIVEDNGNICFVVEAALRTSHPLYHAPYPGEIHCYREIKLVYKNANIVWEEKNFIPIYDASNSYDYGNIDQLLYDNNRYLLSGEWGKVIITALYAPIIK